MALHLSRQTDKLKKMILALGAMVEESVLDAIAAVRTRDTDLALRIIEGDRQIDLMEIDVEEECLHTLALYQPVAMDLRYVVAVLKINNDLERIADLAVNIAEQASFLALEPPLNRAPFDFSQMVGLVQEMLQKSLDSLIQQDVQTARAVRRMDDQVDAIHRQMYDLVAERLRAGTDRVEQLIHLLNLSRQLERIADHTVNIAEDVIYMVEGEILRHSRKHETPAAGNPA